MLKRFIADESGATAIEYGLLAALVCVALISTFVVFGNSLNGLMGQSAGSASETIEEQLAKLR